VLVLRPLALSHHLGLGDNVPLSAVADYFARLGRRAIVEFVPKGDPMVQHMLKARADVFDHYNEAAFKQAFGARFIIDEQLAISPSGRILYLMTRR
jgi:hypothetical protein